MVCALTMTACAGATSAKKYGIEVVQEYPHDATSYTQGLFFDEEGKMCESAGLYGSSSYRKNIGIESGKCEKKIDFEDKYFIEGSCVLNGELFLLTWREHLAFVYDANSLEFKRAYKFPRQGWGLTTDGKQLIASDGSHLIHFLDTGFKRQRSIEVTLDGKKVRGLNELEWIDGKIWANVYLTDEILIINPGNGNVEGIIDCTGLLPRGLHDKNTDVLNGIACDGERIFLTGKCWPRLYEVKLVEKE